MSTLGAAAAVLFVGREGNRSRGAVSGAAAVIGRKGSSGGWGFGIGSRSWGSSGTEGFERG